MTVIVVVVALAFGIALVIARETAPSGLAGHPEDTSANVHLGLGGITNIGNCCRVLQSSTPSIGAVWDWNTGNAAAYPHIYKGDYFPSDRQPDIRYNRRAMPLSWFVARHPDWLEFTCAATHLSERQAIAAGDVAYAFGATTYIPLDTANPAVLSWEERRFWGPAAASGRYQHLDFDNFQMSNGDSSSGRRCGHYSASGDWIQQYNGSTDDPTFRAQEIDLAADIQGWLHAEHPNVAFAANLSWSTNFVPDEEALLSSVDLWFDEQGFSRGNASHPRPYLGRQWVAKARATVDFMNAGGKGWVDMNREPATSVSRAQREWALANYLLLKNDHSWVYICPKVSCYDGTRLWVYPEYAAARVGTPAGSYYADQGVYRRDFSNGLVLVNPSAVENRMVTLPAATYRNLYGRIVGRRVEIPPASAVILVHVRG